MIANERLSGVLGLAMKAGRISSGELAAQKALKSGRAYAAVIDSEASERTKKHWSDMCRYAGVPLVEVREPGRAIGREAHMVACITDKAFAQMVLRIIDNEPDLGGTSNGKE